MFQHTARAYVCLMKKIQWHLLKHGKEDFSQRGRGDLNSYKHTSGILQEGERLRSTLKAWTRGNLWASAWGQWTENY